MVDFMKIYDCFTFYNEIDLLKIRINLLKEYVDYFVLVEMNVTQTGLKKAFIFDEHKNEFADLGVNIIHVKVKDTPKMAHEYDNWLLENYQRNNILQGLKNCQSDDLIMISDLDEFPDPRVIADLKKTKVSFFKRDANIKLLGNIKTLYFQAAYLGMIDPRKLIKIIKDRSLANILKYTPIILEQNIYYYFMNCRSKGFWRGTVILKYNNMILPNNARRLRFYLPVVKNGGWHFSYMGGVKKIKEKLCSIVEGNLNCDKNNIDMYIKNCLDNRVDLFNRKGKEFEYEFIDSHDIGIPNVKKIKNDYPYLFH